MILDELLEYENSSEVLLFKYQYKDTLVWPFVRYQVLNSIVHSYGNIKIRKLPSKVQAPKLSRIARVILKNPFISLKKDIMFIYYGGDVNIKLENGFMYNRLVDDYASIYSNRTYLLENAGQKEYYKRNQKNVRYTDYIDDLIEYKSTKTKVTKQDKEMIDHFINYLRTTLQFEMQPDFWRNLKWNVSLFSKQIKFIDKYYRNLFKLVKPKIVFVGEACYGFQSAFLLKILYDMKIPSAEMQHGVVCIEAYNYSEIIYNSKEYKCYLPNYFLTFGNYWKNDFNLPIKNMVVGSPNFEKSMKNIINRQDEKKNLILVIIAEHESCINLMEKLLPLLDSKYKIELRLHPLEKAAYRWYSKFNKYNNFTIKNECSIYEALNRAEYIIGDVSTALYEAAELGKKVLIYDNNFSQIYCAKVGIRFKTVEELMQIIMVNKFDKHSANLFYDTNWDINYKKFVKHFLL